MEIRITPWVERVGPREVFVFGSNLAGIHGAGAALKAIEFGAELGNPSGIQGNSYAIPTKDFRIVVTLDLRVIERYVNEFTVFAKKNPYKRFYVTEIGCGLADLSPDEVAPLFREASKLENVYLPSSFWNSLTKVVHNKKESFDIYIGRPSKWGNPYSHKDGTIAEFKVDTREEAIEAFREYITVGEGKHLQEDLHEIVGHILGCWCDPKPCHGEVLKELAAAKLLGI